MSEVQAVTALAALAHGLRLRVFRALIIAGPDGLTPGTLAALLDATPSALSFHLKELTHAGLIRAEPRGRHLIYRARFGYMRGLLAYLTEQCCDGRPCGLGSQSTKPTETDDR